MNYVLVIYIFIYLFLFYLFFETFTYNEGFTSNIREAYRPYVRKFRLVSEGFYNKLKDNITIFLKKNGLIL